MNVLEQALNAAELHLQQFEIFALILMRVSAIIFLIPFFESKFLLSRLKVGMSFFISVAIFPMMKDTPIEIAPGTGYLFLLVMKEVMVGLVIGFAGKFLFQFVEFGAEIMNREMGLNQMPIMDPSSGNNSTALGSMIVNIFSVIFLLAGYHRYFFSLLAETFEKIPLTHFQFTPEKWVWIFMSLMTEAFIFGIRFSAPVFATVFITLVGLAFVSKAMPQLNVWIVSIPVKIILGTVTLYFCLPLMWKFFQFTFGRFQEYGRLLIQLGANGG